MIMEAVETKCERIEEETTSKRSKITKLSTKIEIMDINQTKKEENKWKKYGTNYNGQGQINNEMKK